MGRRPVTGGVVDDDILKILEAKQEHPNAITYDLILHTVDEDIIIRELASVETSRDYANNICDYIIVNFTLGLGQCVKKILPYQDNLEMTIVTRYYDKSYTDRYKLVILSGPPSLAGTIYSSYTEIELDKMDKLLMECQCLNRLVEALRLKPCDGVYTYSTVKDIIKTVMTNNINEVNIEDTSVPTNFNLIQPNNDKTYRHINIPVGVRVLDLPSYLQNTDYGVYSADIGTYIQRFGYFQTDIEPTDTVFVYPLYNPGLNNSSGKRLMIFSTPSTLLAQVEHSYLIDGGVIKIIGAGNMTSNEISQGKLINDGNAVIIANPTAIMRGGNTTTTDTVTTDKTTNLTGELLKSKRDGHNSANYVGATANQYKVYSELSKNTLSPYQVTWNYSNPELLYPGMPVSYVYEDSELGVVKLNGVLHSVFNKYSAPYKTNVTIINVLLEPYIDGTNNGNESVDVRY